MGHEANQRGYFEGSYFVTVEEQKFAIGEHVSYYGVAKIVKVEICGYRKYPGNTIKENVDAPYYHVVNIDTGEKNQEFNNTLKKDRLGNLLYG